MRFFQILRGVARRKNYVKSISVLTNRSISDFKAPHIFSKKILTISSVKSHFVHTENDDVNDELFEGILFQEPEILDHAESARTLLFKNPSDSILKELNVCASIEEVLHLVRKYIDIYEPKHITQTILVLRDLQNMFYHYNDITATTTKEFIGNLYESEEFTQLLKAIERKLNTFDPQYLTHVFLYLNKLGIPVEDQLMQSIALKIRDDLLENFALGRCCRFLKVVFTETSVRPYYLSLNIIPKVISQIGKCDSVKDLSNLTICLNKLHHIVTKQTLKDYKEKVQEFLNNKKLQGTDYSALLNIIMFLNYPKWRNENVLLTSDCISLCKNEINSLNIDELIILYEVFFKNQEPGDILNTIQRCSAKMLHQLEETGSVEVDKKLRLFSSLIYFSSPTNRIQFRKDIAKYSRKCNSFSNLVLLRKIYSYVKISDKSLCSKYWDLSMKMLSEDKSATNILKSCQNYMNFNTDVNNYRDQKFERRILQLIEESIESEAVLFPTIVSGYLSFVMVYGKKQEVLEHLLNKFKENVSQFKAYDCLKISHSLLLSTESRNSCVSQKQIKIIKTLLNECTSHLTKYSESDHLQNIILLKASILRNDCNNSICENLLMNFKKLECMSSKIMENICFILLSTDTLIPEVINNCTEYVVKHPNNILGFNAEKILFLCYYLAYYPINADRFFEVITDIIIRDQERLSGLAFLQSALALCFFNKLPGSFIKQIFNVEFLDKLDLELANCYSKDRYPQRVRSNLMQLNRAVCLEYPECNVPWFHKKYMEEIQNRFTVKDTYFHQRVKAYLIQVLGNPQYISENVITPYGYHIHFVINLNKKEEIVLPNSNEVNKRVAFVLIKEHAFTRLYTHLKGKYQMKKRHLEMFGYGVAVVNLNDWMNLLYAGERIEYLKKLIWPDSLKASVKICER